MADSVVNPPVVLHIAPTPFFADRGCHIRIRNEIDSLQGRSVSVILCTYHHGRDIEGFRIHRIPRIPGYTKLDAGYSAYKFVADALLFLLTLKMTWRHRPKLLHAHLHEGALIGWLVKCCLFWRRMPLIMDVQGSLTGELESYGILKAQSALAKLTSWIERQICRMPDFTFCSSETSRRILTGRFLVNPHRTALLRDVVPDRFYDPQDRHALERKLRIPVGKQVVLYTGSLLPGKGVQHVLEALRFLASRRDDMIFVLLGYPVGQAQAFVDRYGLADHALLPGRVSYDDLSLWLAVGDVALEPKQEEAGEASGKVLHYMASGLPVVCFRTPNNEALLGELGFYAVRKTAHAFAEILEHALAMDKNVLKTRGQEGRNLVRRVHATQAIGGILEAKYGALYRHGA